jgi:hypothetical protein
LRARPGLRPRTIGVRFAVWLRCAASAAEPRASAAEAAAARSQMPGFPRGRRSRQLLDGPRNAWPSPCSVGARAERRALMTDSGGGYLGALLVIAMFVVARLAGW